MDLDKIKNIFKVMADYDISAESRNFQKLLLLLSTIGLFIMLVGKQSIIKLSFAGIELNVAKNRQLFIIFLIIIGYYLINFIVKCGFDIFISIHRFLTYERLGEVGRESSNIEKLKLIEINSRIKSASKVYICLIVLFDFILPVLISSYVIFNLLIDL